MTCPSMFIARRYSAVSCAKMYETILLVALFNVNRHGPKNGTAVLLSVRGSWVPI